MGTISFFLTVTFGQGSRNYFDVVGVGVQTFIEFCQISLEKGQNGSSEKFGLVQFLAFVQFLTFVQFQTRCNFKLGAIF